MTILSIQNAVELTKRLYPNGLDEIMYRDIPLYGLAKKWTGFMGEGEFLVWKFAPGGGASSVFGNAQANKGVPGLKRPFITRAKEYATASIDGEMMRAAGSNLGSIARPFKVQMDGANYNITRAIGFNAYRNGGGARGQLLSSGSGVGTDTVTLSTDSSFQGFEYGMWVNAALTDGTSGTVLVGKAQITGVNVKNRTLKTTAAWNTLIPGIGDGYYLFRDGDFGNVMKGLEAWIPTTAPTAGDNFFGADRSAFPEKLAGLRWTGVDGTNAVGTIQETLQAAASYAMDFGAKPDTVMMNPRDVGNLVNEIGSKQTIPVPSTKAGIGYDAVELYSAIGKTKVIADPGCPRFKAYMLTLDSWELWSAGPVPGILDEDGVGTLLREPNADAYELRVGGFLQWVCHAPGHNVNISLPTAI